MTYFMYALPLWVIFCTIVAVSMLAVEGGSRLAQKVNRAENRDNESHVEGIVAALLGLLAFILAFSFSITTNRLDERKQLVLEEANAISTTYLRAGLIPQSQGDAIKKLLVEYVDLRLKMAVGPKDMVTLLSRSEDIHLLMWAQAASLVNTDMDSEIRSLFITSLNEVIDLHETRKTVVFIYRIPAFIWFSLIVLLVLSMFGTGYRMAGSNIQRHFAVLLMASSFALVIIIIAAMDRPGESLFSVSQQPLAEVLEMMKKPQ